jgi:hypothetical protein
MKIFKLLLIFTSFNSFNLSAADQNYFGENYQHCINTVNSMAKNEYQTNEFIKYCKTNFLKTFFYSAECNIYLDKKGTFKRVKNPPSGTYGLKYSYARGTETVATLYIDNSFSRELSQNIISDDDQFQAHLLRNCR